MQSEIITACTLSLHAQLFMRLILTIIIMCLLTGWCSLFNAELALSVTMTGLSTFLSVIFLPLNLVIYASTSYSSEVVDSLDWAGLILSLVVVLGGIASGIFMSYLRNSTRFNLLANKVGNLAGIGLVVFSFLVTSSSKDASLWEQDFKFYFAVALPAVLGVAIATVLAAKYDLEKPERVAVAVEACYQNTGIATSVAFTMFDGDELATAVGVPLFYGICEMVILAVYCIVCWKLGWTKAPADENIFKVIAKSYEVEKASLNSPNAIEVVNGQVFTSTTEGYKVDEESLRESSNAETKQEGSDANGKHQRIPADDKELI